MGKARMLGQYRPFVPNRYADMRRRPATTLGRLERMEQQREDRKAKKEMKELEDCKNGKV